MTKAATIHLGFTVGTGTPVAIPLAHMCVTGMTQQAGKTTALEALITRSGFRAVTFITKRGEGSFAGGRRMPPFFRERADWVFVSSLIDATLGEKNKLLRAWLMKVCRNTHTLAEVQRNVKAAKQDARGFAESIYTEIEGYLELVVPQLAQLPPARAVVIGQGLNVMDLSPYSSELQGLVIRSVIEHVYEHEDGVVTVIPEAWEFLPEGRGSPVKREAEQLIRKGAGLQNFMWIDSQDLAGVMKLAVRACPIVLVGVQREANEIKRTLANIPAGIAKPSAADIATLELGQFYACWGSDAIKTYVQPAWMDDDHATGVAVGTISVDQVIRQQASISREATAVARRFGVTKEEAVTKDEAARLTRENEQLKKDNADLRRRLEALEKGQHAPEPERPTARRARAADAPAEVAAATPPASTNGHVDEALYQAIKARILDELPNEPVLLRIVEGRSELLVELTKDTVTIDGTSLKGRIGRLIANGFFDDGQTQGATRSELKRTGSDVNQGNLWRTINDLVKSGFLTNESGNTYRAVAGMKVNVVEN